MENTDLPCTHPWDSRRKGKTDQDLVKTTVLFFSLPKKIPAKRGFYKLIANSALIAVQQYPPPAGTMHAIAPAMPDGSGALWRHRR